MQNNPFSISFGVEPKSYIPRYSQLHEVTESFLSEAPSSHTYMICGVRGSGKTVLLTGITDELRTNRDWIIVNVTPDVDILHSICARLYSIAELQTLFINAKLDFSAFGIGLSLEKSNPIFDLGTALERMLEELRKKGKKVLVAIDEIVSNHAVQVFVGIFQILLREKLPVYLIMTGLYENIQNLQKEKTISFLYRSPKIMLEPLRIASITTSYAQIFSISRDSAMALARLTKGYPFAYQVLGYLYWKQMAEAKANNEKCEDMDTEELLTHYDELLEEYVYEKIWSELSPREREIIAAIPPEGEIKIKEIRERLGLAPNQMSVYRDRLRKKGVISTTKYGFLSLVLPRFGEIISVWTDESDYS